MGGKYHRNYHPDIEKVLQYMVKKDHSVYFHNCFHASKALFIRRLIEFYVCYATNALIDMDDKG